MGRRPTNRWFERFKRLQEKRPIPQGFVSLYIKRLEKELGLK